MPVLAVPDRQAWTTKNTKHTKRGTQARNVKWLARRSQTIAVSLSCVLWFSWSAHPCSIPVSSVFHPCSIRVPSVFHPCSIRVPSVFHPCSIRVPSVFRPCFVRSFSLNPKAQECKEERRKKERSAFWASPIARGVQPNSACGRTRFVPAMAPRLANTETAIRLLACCPHNPYVNHLGQSSRRANHQSWGLLTVVGGQVKSIDDMGLLPRRAASSNRSRARCGMSRRTPFASGLPRKMSRLHRKPANVYRPFRWPDREFFGEDRADGEVLRVRKSTVDCSDGDNRTYRHGKPVL